MQITGQLKVIRYYPVGFPNSFEIMKEQMPAQCNLTDDQVRAVREAVCLSLVGLFAVDGVDGVDGCAGGCVGGCGCVVFV